jgi:hypothetical protein
MSEERNANGHIVAHKPTFSEIIDHLIQDRQDSYDKITKLKTALKEVTEMAKIGTRSEDIEYEETHGR